MGVGVSQLRGASVDVLPEFTPPYVEIQTEAIGLSADEVEQLVTVPMEADLLNGVEGVDVIRSQSLPGLSSIVLVFDPEFDLYTARALVQERLTQTGAAALPNISKPPVMLQPYSSSSRVLMFSLASEKVSPIEKSVIARWVVQPRLLGVPGVANVSIWGFRDRQLVVQVDPERLRANDVTLSQVVETAGNAQISTPLSHLEGSTPGTGGFIETPQQRLGVRHVFDKLIDPKQLGLVPIDGAHGKRLADVANVVVDHQPLIGDAIVAEDPGGLMLVVEKFPGADAREVTRGVEAALEDLKPGLAGMEPDTSLFRPATFIETAMDNLTLALMIAGALLALIIAAFLFQWRTIAISLLTIPLSMVAAALVLDWLGQTFNAISFAGLAVALLVVIDDAVAGAENVARHLHRHRDVGSDRPTADIVRQASHEVRRPLTYATFIALLAIVPIAMMDGRPGAFFEPLVLGYAAAVTAAMVIAMTVTPALSLLLFSKGSAVRRESPILRFLRPRYESALSYVLPRSRAVLVAAIAAVAAGAAILPFLGTSLIPSFKDRDVIVHLNAEPGTSVMRMKEIATDVSRELRAIPGVDNVGAHVGRAITGDRLVDVNSGDVWVTIDSGADYDATMAAIEATAARAQGARADVVSYTEQKLRDVGALREGENAVTGDGLDVLTGSSRPLTVRVYGENLQLLRREAAKVRTLMSKVDGVVDPRVIQPPVQPNIEIEVDLERAKEHGIKPGDVRRAEATLVQGPLVGSVFEEQKVFEVVVRGTPEMRRTVDDVRNLLINTPEGGYVRLRDVADVRVVDKPIAIKRDAVSRYLDVEANVSGRGLGDVASEIDGLLKESVLPLEFHAAVLTHTTAAEIGQWKMLVAAIAAVLAMFLLMQAALMSWRLALVGSLTLPVALVGGAAAALINGAELSLGAAIGFLALLALAARNTLILIRHFQDLERHEGETFGPELILRGARERLMPVLATASAAGAAAVVMIALGSRPGLEIVSPLAAVMLGGLVTTTLLSMFVLPALYLRFGGHQPEMSPEEELLLEEWALAQAQRATAGATLADTPADPADDAGAVVTTEAGVGVADGHEGAGEPPPGSRSTTSEAVARTDEEQGGEHGGLGLSPA